MKVAIVHYWLVAMRGGEKVLEALLELFPDADLYTHVWDPTAISTTLNARVTGTSFIQRLPRAKHWYRHYLPLMPLALEQLDLSAYDLVISSESGPAKGVIVAPEARHLCYCHTPMRYLWDQYPMYWRNAAPWLKWALPPLFHVLRQWDVTSAARVDAFAANSRFVQQRIARYYRRDSVVIHPPVATQDFALAEAVEDYYLIVSQLVDYKNVRLAVETFNENGKPLVIIGTGPEEKTLRRLARPNVKLLGKQPFAVMRHHYAHCRALIFPGVEDFGIVPVEAMASGRPVIALGRGGACDTVIDGVTGVLFYPATPAALDAALQRFEAQRDDFDPQRIRRHAATFDRAVFLERFRAWVEREMAMG